MRTVAEVMTREVLGVAPDTSLETAARLMAQRHITGLPVLGRNGRPLGVVTLADLIDPDRPRSTREGYPLYYQLTAQADGLLGMRAAGAASVPVVQERGDGVTLGEGQVADVMSPFVLSIESNATLVEAANRMVSESVHRLLVMDDAELVGIVTSTDLLRAFATELR